ncbi:MAG: cyclic nucleotide-binding domain-containing protein [Polyangiaceae bacterium]|nr:cyclic nucleotide-binding domain-containing protein [Polyangiaceae bacterium]
MSPPPSHSGGEGNRRWVDVTERAIYLRSLPVAGMLPTKVLHAIARSLVERTFEPGAKLLEQGKPVRHMRILTAGRLTTKSGDRVIGQVVPPESVGFLNLLAHNDGSYDAIAVEPVHALELSADRFYTLLEDHYPLLLTTLQYTAERLLHEMKELPQEALGLPPTTFPIAVPERRLDLVERVFFMRCVSAFANTNLGALAVLAEHMSEARVPAGHPFFSIGDKSSFTVFILSGIVECEAPDGRIFEYGGGTAAGGVEALAGKERWYSARAKTPVVALIGTADALVELMEDNFEIGSDFIRMLVTGLQGMLSAKAARVAASKS